MWPDVKEVIPMMRVYETRTDRNIRMFRLRPLASGQPSSATP